MGRKKLYLTYEEKRKRNRMALKKSYEKNKEKKLIFAAKYYEKNKEKKIQAVSESYKRNKLQKRKVALEYYYATKEEKKAKKQELMLGLYEAEKQVEYLQDGGGELKEECEFSEALTFNNEEPPGDRAAVIVEIAGVDEQEAQPPSIQTIKEGEEENMGNPVERRSSKNLELKEIASCGNITEVVKEGPLMVPLQTDVNILKPAMKIVEKVHLVQRHSFPFHISPKLFRNKLLKRRRIKRQKLLKYLKEKPILKTDKYKIKNNKRQSFNLTADVTINLISDDEGIANDSQVTIFPKPFIKTKKNPVKNLVEPLYINTGIPMELCKKPNITLVPVVKNNYQHLNAIPNQTNKNINNNHHNNKRKRKSQQPQRISCQLSFLNESIVLSDDEAKQNQQFGKQKRNQKHSNIAANNEYFASNNQVNLEPIQHSIPVYNNYPIKSLQVDEEVTVSLVPRNSAAGSCSNSYDNNNSPFPMLPDETTVHTVIANRKYELSLAKLREGLASSNIPADPQSQSSVSQKRKTKGNLLSPLKTQPHANPISLKLSSDLSISLISDDDEEEQLKQILQAEKLLQQHPQLSVQHLQFPPAAVTVVHRREKLG